MDVPVEKWTEGEGTNGCEMSPDQTGHLILGFCFVLACLVQTGKKWVEQDTYTEPLTHLYEPSLDF